MLSEEEIRNLSPAERLELTRVLARLAETDLDPGPVRSGRRRALMLAFIVVCCIVLAAWIGVLAVTLPRYYRSGGWRGAWVGFDVALLIAFAATGWAAWRRRQLLVICLIVLATLLCCDAWFDVVLDARTSGFWVSLATALIIELPLAALATAAARRLLRLNLNRIRLLEGLPGEVQSLRRTPLIGAASVEHLLDLFPGPDGGEPGWPATGPGGLQPGHGGEKPGHSPGGAPADLR
ncbi:MAG: hypothetical protein ACLQDY_19885 [Streptosporangiaceae bacterium]